jgi:hypothetical protein
MEKVIRKTNKVILSSITGKVKDVVTVHEDGSSTFEPMKMIKINASSCLLFDIFDPECFCQVSMDIDKQEGITELCEETLGATRQFKHDGLIWRYLGRSPSSDRNAVATFTTLNILEIFNKVSAGYLNLDGSINGKKIDASKFEPRMMMCQSQSYSVGNGFKFTIKSVPDIELKEVRYVYNSKSESFTLQTVKVNRKAFDGGACGDFLVFARIALRDGRITKAEYEIFCKLYLEMDLEWLMSSKIFCQILDKLSSGLQIRHIGDKGLIIKVPLKKLGFDDEIIGDESFRKYQAPTDDDLVDVRVCKVSKATKKAFLNGQAINHMDITPETLYEIAKERSLKHVENVLTDVNAAKKFLGMMNKSEVELEAIYKNMVPKVIKLLLVDEDLLMEPCVQEPLRDLLEVYLNDVAKGRVEVEGHRQFVTCDPMYFLTGKACLQRGENYFNGVVKEWGLIRNPMSFKSEFAVVNTVACPELWYLKDILVLNVFDDTLERLAGADIDGDEVIMVADQRIIEAMRKGANAPLTHNAGIPNPGKKMDYDFNAPLDLENIFNPSMIGLVCDRISALREYQDTTGTPNSYEGFLMLGQLYCSWEVDRAKTGGSFTPEFFFAGLGGEIEPMILGQKWKRDSISFKKIQKS